MAGRLDGRVAVVTGGASGMGRGTVERFLEEGAAVVAGDLNAERGEELLAACGATGHGERLRFTRVDVAQETDVAGLVSLAVEAFGRLDVMFNNAGIGGAFGPLTELDVEAWDETFAVDTRSVFLGIKHAARVMIDAGRGGSIINTASIAGLGSGGGPMAYSAAKAAVANLSQSAALELAPHRIRVNAICPGVIYTPLMHLGDEARADEWVTRLQPWPGRGEPRHIAGAALWLASDDSEFVTGQNIVVDGGLLAAGPRVVDEVHSLNPKRIAGMTYGTTGRRPRVRRLGDADGLIRNGGAVRFGYITMNSASGIHPAPLAKELEARGFESMWVPEHTHIPTSRRSPFVGGGDLPTGYLHMMSPFVSLAAASAVTERLLLGTAVALLLEHDLVDLATQTATLDVISGGRLLLGIGVGWNQEELFTHRPDLPFRSRYGAARERIAALRTLWRDEVAGVEGRWDRVEPSWVYPKPVNGTIPIVSGSWGELALRHAAADADHWMPVDRLLVDAEGRPDVAGGVERFRRMVAEEGRDPDTVPVSLVLFARPTPARVERYTALGIERMVISAPTGELVDEDFTRRDLDSVMDVVQEYGEP